MRRIVIRWAPWLLTLAWGATVYLTVKSLGTAGMKLADWATFVAGITSPLAILWLVLGFYQQGEELKQNTKALHAQEIQLQKQAEETNALVRTMAAEVRMVEEQMNLARNLRKPHWVRGPWLLTHPGYATLGLRNQGGPVFISDVKMERYLCKVPALNGLIEKEGEFGIIITPKDGDQIVGGPLRITVLTRSQAGDEFSSEVNTVV